MTNPNPAPHYEQVAEPGRITVRKSEVRQRSQLVGVRLTPSEHADLARLAAAKHCSLPDVLRAGLAIFTATETTDVR